MSQEPLPSFDSSSQSLFSILRPFASETALPPVLTQDFHRFSSPNSAPPWDALQRIISTTSMLSASLNSLSSTSENITNLDSKTIALLKQHLGECETLVVAEQENNQRVKAFRERKSSLYGEDVPISRLLIPSWCIEKLELWGKAAGMETFKDPRPAGDHDQMTIVFGGKVLVIDIDLAIYNDPVSPRVELESLKTSLATVHSDSTPNSQSHASDTVDHLLSRTLRVFLNECQKNPDEQDCHRIRSLSETFQEHLRQLARIDGLVSLAKEDDSTDNGGESWFDEVRSLSAVCEKLALQEGSVISGDVNSDKIPLDIFLRRAHGIPLAHLNSPSLSFLIHLSPIAYLTMLRSSPSQTENVVQREFTSLFDIPLSHIRETLQFFPDLAGVTQATLKLTTASPVLIPSISDDIFMSISRRPTSLSNDITFPSRNLLKPPKSSSSKDEEPLCWVLDFGSRGIVMSQNRMKEIQDILGIPEGPPKINPVSFGSRGSWVDLLFDPVHGIQHERYLTAIHSPSDSFPVVDISLNPPPEIGFALGRVCVLTLNEVWAIIEIVKEQCWLNANLKMHEWRMESGIWPQSTFSSIRTDLHMETDPMQELEDLLNKTRVPERLLVSASISTSPKSTSRVKLTIPTRSFKLSQVEVTYDPSRPRAVTVTVDGSQVPWLEEVTRRGGVFAVCSRVWANSV